MGAAELSGLSGDALYIIVRSLAERGQDHGYSVYYQGPTISRAERARMISEDDAAIAGPVRGQASAGGGASRRSAPSTTGVGEDDLLVLGLFAL